MVVHRQLERVIYFAYVVFQSMDRGGSSIQSKRKTLTPFVLRSNREDLAALCQQAAVSSLPDPQPSAVNDHHRSAAELKSTSPQINRRIFDQRPTGGQMDSSKLHAGSSALLDARSRLQVAGGNRSWGPRTLSATSAGAPAAGDGGSEYGSCASVELTASTTSASAVHDADISSAVDSDVTAASELRRRRRAELVRARTAGDQSAVAGGSILEKPGDVGNESRTTSDQLGYPATLTTDSVAFRQSGISTTPSSSTSSLHLPVIPSTGIDADLPVVAQRAAEQPTTQQSFQQTHSKTPWRSIRPANEITCDAIQSRPLDHRSRHAIATDHLQQSLPMPAATLLPSSSSGIASFRSPSATSVEGVKSDFRKPETRLKTSVYGSAPSVAMKTEPATTISDVPSFASAAASRAKPRITICSSDMRDHDAPDTITGDEAVPTKDRFNELVGKALESTSSAGGHHERSTEPPPHHKSSESDGQYVDGNATESPPKKEEIETESSKSFITAEPDARQSRQTVSLRYNREPNAVSNITTDTTQASARESVQSLSSTVNKDSHHTTTSGQHHPSKQHISESFACVSVTTQNTPVTSTGDIFSQRSQAGSSQHSAEKMEDSTACELPVDVKKEPVHRGKEKRDSEHRLNKNSRKAGKHSRQSNVVEETQIVQILSFGGDSKSHCSTSTSTAAAASPATDTLTQSYTADLVKLQPEKLLQQQTKSPDENENISNVSREVHSKLDQSLASTSCRNTLDVRALAVSKASVPDTDTKQQTPMIDQINRSDVQYTVVSSNTVQQELNIATDDSRSVDLKPLTVVQPRISEADLTSVEPPSEQEAESIHRPVQTAAVMQTIDMATGQVLSQKSDTELTRVKPVNVESSVDTADSGRFVANTGCQYHADLLKFPASETGESCEKFTDQNAEKSGQLERLKPQIVESSFDAAEARRFLTKTSCQYHTNVLTLAAGETVDRSQKHMQLSAQFQQLKPQKVESAFNSVNARPYLRITGCHYHTNLLTFHPTEKDVIVQTNSRKPAVNQYRETTRNIEGLKSEWCTKSTVQDSCINRKREMVKVLPVPQILTMSPQHRQPVARETKPYDTAVSLPVLEQTTEQKVMPSTSVRAVPKSDVEPLATFPVAPQEVEIAKNASREIRTLDFTQPAIGNPSVRSSDKLPSNFQVSSPSAGSAKSDGKNTSAAVAGELLVRDQRVPVSAADSASRVSVSELAETSIRQKADTRWANQPQNQDKAPSASQPSNMPEQKQLLKSEKSCELVDVACARVSQSARQAVNTSSSVVTSIASRSSQSTVPTDLSTYTHEGKTVSLSDNHGGPTAPGDRAVTEQHRANFALPVSDDSDTAIAVKRDSTNKKARNILRTREDFLSLQLPTPTSTDVTDAMQRDLGKTSAQPEQASTTRKTTDPAKKDAIDTPSEPRPSRTLKIALSEDDPDEEYEDDEGHIVVPADTAKAAFPPLVSGRSWDAIVRSSSLDEPASPVKIDRRPVEPRRTAVPSRVVFSAAPIETTAIVPDTSRVPRPILQLAKSVDAEPCLSRAVNMDPELAAVLRKRKQREEELEREAALKAEETGNPLYAENRFAKVERLLLFENNNNKFRLMMVKKNRSTLHTVSK